MREEDIIEKYLLKLTNGNKFALNLTDDIAQIDIKKILKTDTTIEGVHILKNLPANFIAYKAMARCFSDIFAKGGRIDGYLTNIIIPHNFERFDELFSGFSQFTEKYNADLIGGDLSRYNGDGLIIVVSALAEIDTFTPRFGAKVGDEIYLTKKIGCAYLGFLDAQNGLLKTENANEYLMPTLTQIQNFEGVNATMDISDGLIQDARKMAKASNLAFEIDYNLLPFAEKNNAKNQEMLSFGDDYNVLLCSATPVINAVKIGICKNGNGLILNNFPFEITKEGYNHFA